ncbi:MAG: 8-amino-7-oxononanoate synthase [Planctomycetaceae bacterium]
MAYRWLQTELEAKRQAALVRRPRRVQSLESGWCEVDGRKLRNFASNDYLGLAADERVLAAAACALDEAGAGARASALVCGRSEWHDRLEQELAKFEGTEAVLLFPTGFAANAGTIPALVGPGDAVLCDRLNHASLVDGCKMSGAKLLVYPHADVATVQRLLVERTDFRRRMIVTDSLFSMDGDAAPLAELANLAEEHNAMLLVDEAHATGLFGTHGRGLTETAGINGVRVVKTGTLSKAIGAQGGFVAGTRTLIDWLYNTARTQMFSTALAPAACAAALAAIDIIRTEPERRGRLLAESARLCETLRRHGLSVPAGVTGPIIPIVLGSEQATLAAARELEERGDLVAAIRPPTVPRGTSRLRISLSAAHPSADIDALADALTELLRDSISSPGSA